LLTKTRKRNLHPRLTEVSDKISEAIDETRTIRDLTVQEEVLDELGKVSAVLARARKAISKVKRARKSNSFMYVALLLG
jgi:hypothetical protein